MVLLQQQSMNQKLRRFIFLCNDGANCCFIESTHDAFIDTTCGIIDKCNSLINATTRQGNLRAGKREHSGFLSLLALPLILEVMEKEVTRAGKAYIDVRHLHFTI